MAILAPENTATTTEGANAAPPAVTTDDTSLSRGLQIGRDCSRRQSVPGTPPPRHVLPPARRTVAKSSPFKRQSALWSSRGFSICLLSAFLAAMVLMDTLAFSRDLVGISQRCTELLADLWRSVGFWDLTILSVLSAFAFRQKIRQHATVAQLASASCSAQRRGLTMRPASAENSPQRGCASQPSSGRQEEDDSGSTPPQLAEQAGRYAQVIETAARNDDPERACKYLTEWEKCGGKPDSVTYGLVIRACARKGDSYNAERWFLRMERAGATVTVCTYNTLLDAFVKAGRTEACEACLERMIERGFEANVISYATAIYARARYGQEAEAEKWLRRMIKAGVEPDAVSYNSLIHACGVRGSAENAEKWIQEMKSRGLEPTVTTYTAAIDACAKCMDLKRAEKLMSKLLEEGVEPNVVTFSALIDVCAKAGDSVRAEHWHDQMVARGIKPNAHSYSAVINSCAKARNVEAAERWLDKSEAAGIAGDVVVYSSMIDACGKAGDADRAMAVFVRMQEAGIQPHIVAYAALARPFAYRGDWEEVERLEKCLLRDGVETNEYFIYAQLLSYAAARPQQTERAERCFRSALAKGIPANDHIVNVLCRAMGRARCQDLLDELCDGRQVPKAADVQRRKDRKHTGGGQVQRSSARRVS
eukprot:TRINITY_DN45189_c0_g1_i1.p1 TRINITY_DN45189_c0_g1~~TRINITY_DN45189_c0_g1_i1.p1  ORF type:complete len:649 (-),score=101.98 TRINITY_DN45189_c0_g1_i1:287-2233(-)